MLVFMCLTSHFKENGAQIQKDFQRVLSKYKQRKRGYYWHSSWIPHRKVSPQTFGIIDNFKVGSRVQVWENQILNYNFNLKYGTQQRFQ